MEVGNEMEIFISLTKYNTHQRRDEGKPQLNQHINPPHKSVRHTH